MKPAFLIPFNNYARKQFLKSRLILSGIHFIALQIQIQYHVNSQLSKTLKSFAVFLEEYLLEISWWNDAR
jgi:hypothetical protein